MRVVFAPLPHIAVHVMETPAIGREAGYLRSLLSINALGAKAVGEMSVGVIAIIIRQIGGKRFSKPEWRGAAGAAGVFPLGLTRQPVALARALAQTAAELLRIKPAHPLHRTVRSLEIGGIGNQVALHLFPIRHHLPLGLGDRCLRHEERVKRHDVLGALVGMATRLLLR
jgi:hypothetical protein